MSTQTTMDPISSQIHTYSEISDTRDVKREAPHTRILAQNQEVSDQDLVSASNVLGSNPLNIGIGDDHLESSMAIGMNLGDLSIASLGNSQFSSPSSFIDSNNFGSFICSDSLQPSGHNSSVSSMNQSNLLHINLEEWNWPLQSPALELEAISLASHENGSDISYPASQYDQESYVTSPVSPSFSNILSARSRSTSSYDMSATITQNDILRPSPSPISSSAASTISMTSSVGLLASLSPSASITRPLTPSTNTTAEDQIDDGAESDDVLDELLHGFDAAEDGRYHCYRVNADGHSCDFAADRKCMLRKHLESTLKTNICRVPECNGLQFSSKAVLTRHEKEAHKMHGAYPYNCPVETCDRRIRGFPREYNMGDHIQRVHKELDVQDFLKKTKRAPKKSATTSSKVSGSSGVRKSGSIKSRRDQLEKQYRNSREKIGKLSFKLPEQSNAAAQKYIQQLKAEVSRLEEASLGLAAQATSSLASVD